MKKNQTERTKIHKKIRMLEKEFSLSRMNHPYRYLVLPREEIVLRNFLGECPSPDFDRYGGRRNADRAKKIGDFVASPEFRRHSRKAQGCLIPTPVAKRERMLSKTVTNASLRLRLLRMYDRIIRHSGRGGLILVSPPETEKDRRIFLDILTHESIHNLLIENGIHFYAAKPSYWKWDEGLCVYLEYFAERRHLHLLRPPRRTKNHLWNKYLLYAHKWAKEFAKVGTPLMRLRIIRNKLLRQRSLCQRQLQL